MKGGWVSSILTFTQGRSLWLGNLLLKQSGRLSRAYSQTDILHGPLSTLQL